MSVSAAPTIASFQLSCTGDSAADTMRRAHLHALGAERERGRHRPAVADAAGGDHRHVDLRADERQQHHRGDVARVLEPAALAAFDDEPVDAGVDRLQRGRAAWARRGTP